MEICLPKILIDLIKIFENNNFKCFVVGGGIRDTLLGMIPKEFDICTDASTSDMKILFKVFKDEKEELGCIKIFFENMWFEVTTLRIERNYFDFRHPLNVEFTKNYLEDSKRRDFTINSIYFDGRKILDPLNGISDLENGILRGIGDRNLKFLEDPLRILRCLRFKSKFNFKIEFETLMAIKNNFHLIKHLTSFRVSSELREIFENIYFYDSIRIFKILNGFQIIFDRDFEIFDLREILNLNNKFHIKIFCILYFHSNIEKSSISNILNDNLNFTKNEIFEINLIIKILNEEISINKNLFIKNLILNYGYDTSFNVLKVLSVYNLNFKNILHKFFKIKWGYSPIKVSHMNLTLGKILKNKKNITKYNKYLVTILHSNPNLNNKKSLLHLFRNKFKP